MHSEHKTRQDKITLDTCREESWHRLLPVIVQHKTTAMATGIGAQFRENVSQPRECWLGRARMSEGPILCDGVNLGDRDDQHQGLDRAPKHWDTSRASWR